MKLLVFVTLFLHAAIAQNNYPIVLVHGFLGWGPTELLGFKYWGGLEIDVANFLQSQGYQVFTVGVGPVSSSYDRACEVFAQVKGGTVDYGQAHSTKFGHSRYGRTYAGLYPNWGTVDSNGNIRKVHIIAHSQGGQDSRILTRLLNNGSPAEIALGGTISTLFKGGNPWIASVSTLTSPHDGTSLATQITTFLPFVKDLVVALGALAGSDTNNMLYDFKLDQWGLQRNVGESWSSYSGRIWASNIWTNTKDLSVWTLSPDGAAEINAVTPADPKVFYITWAGDATYSGLFGIAYPDPWQLLILQPLSLWMGGYNRNSPGLVTIDSTWHHNDGVVNTRSHAGPTLSSSDIITAVTPNSNGISTFTAGRFNFLGTLSGWDHLAIVGDNLVNNIKPNFQRLANLLKTLPANVVANEVWQTSLEVIPANVSSNPIPTSDIPVSLDCATLQQYYNSYCLGSQSTNSTACTALVKNLSSCPQQTGDASTVASAFYVVSFIAMYFCLYL